MLSIRSRMEHRALFFVKLLIAKEPARSSKQFMCNLDSSVDHVPPVEIKPQRAPQPVRLASDSNTRSGTEGKMDLPFQASKWDIHD
ncbi:hypothetical protein NDU88_000960 [Pleurodeles waltl]|uniref:Uncharacterized protein n=1 Tax=Pleurodeles waltl TaxID=8319 RepID=A0AAV7URH4_PLEWA|nr:hypothetical protein NDU88_000960 [Pleurodeles waltl]